MSQFEELENLYKKFLEDSNVEDIKMSIGAESPNIFKILRVANTEIRHSNFLSWLLDPKANHNLNEAVLSKFLQEIINSSDNFDESITLDDIGIKNVEIRREWENIDLLIILDEYVVCIENKIFSGEHSDQLTRYKNIVETRFSEKTQIYVYLNPFGYSSFRESDVYLPISYQVIIDILENLNLDEIDTTVKSFIEQYLLTLKRDVMGIDENAELAQEIYKEHKELFDYIYEIMPDGLENVGNYIQDVLISKNYKLGSRSKQYVRFYPSEIEQFIYFNKSKNQWDKRETFLFEIFYNKKQIRISLGMNDAGDDEYDRGKLNEILQILDPKGGRHKRWKHYLVQSFPYELNQFYEKTEEEIKSDIEKILEEYKIKIDSLIKHLNTNSKELILLLP